MLVDQRVGSPVNFNKHASHFLKNAPKSLGFVVVTYVRSETPSKMVGPDVETTSSIVWTTNLGYIGELTDSLARII
jgi:hypothetical protein